MANPFYTNNSQRFQNSSSSYGSINDIYKLLSNSNNPMQIFNNIAKNNPNMAPIVSLLNNGYSPQQVFNTMCQQRGINPQEFIKNITR